MATLCLRLIGREDPMLCYAVLCLFVCDGLRLRIRERERQIGQERDGMSERERKQDMQGRSEKE